MIGKRGWVRAGLAVGLLAAGLLIVASLFVGVPDRNALAVYRLMLDAGTVMYTGLSSAEVIHVDGRSMIAVIYEPNPRLPTSATNPADAAGQPGDDWVAKEKTFVELGRGNRVDNVLVGLGVRRPRSVERDALPR